MGGQTAEQSRRGVIRYAKNAAAEAIFDIAELHRRAAAGDMPSIADWDAADRAARAVYRFYGAGGSTLGLGGLDAVRAGYQSTALVYTDHRATLSELDNRSDADWTVDSAR